MQCIVVIRASDVGLVVMLRSKLAISICIKIVGEYLVSGNDESQAQCNAITVKDLQPKVFSSLLDDRPANITKLKDASVLAF